MKVALVMKKNEGAPTKHKYLLAWETFGSTRATASVALAWNAL